MNWDAWSIIEGAISKWGIKPIMAVVPENCDPELQVAASKPDFWDHVRRWNSLSWPIALHGYRHQYVTDEAGMLGVNRYSEFAGLTVVEQEKKIRSGLSIFNTHGIKTKIWVAPAHSFDRVTISILKRYGLTIISDGWYTYPGIDRDGILWLPQQLWAYEKRKSGIWTICLHINKWNEDQIDKFVWDLSKYKDNIFDLPTVLDQYGDRKLGINDKMMSCLRRMRFYIRRYRSNRKLSKNVSM